MAPKLNQTYSTKHTQMMNIKEPQKNSALINQPQKEPNLSNQN